MNKIILSVLIPSIPERFEQLSLLMDKLSMQVNSLDRDHPSFRKTLNGPQR